MGTRLQTRREYLIGLGLAKEGRGKFSNVAKEALAKADAEGVEFLDGPSPSGPRPVADKPVEPVVKSAGESPYLYPSDFRFPEAEYVAVTSDGKRHSMRECCNTCKVSLTNHACDRPTIHNNLTVNIRKVG